MIKYRGGKSREIPHIMWHIPRFTGRYVEPFLGGGALFFHLEPKRSIINDINQKLMSFYRGVRDTYADLRKELDEVEAIYTKNREEFDAQKAVHPEERVADKNEDLYYDLRAMFNETKDKRYSDALLYYFINKTAYSGMIRYNARGEFNVPFGRYKQLNTQMVTEKHSRLLQCAEIYNADYKEVFDMCKADDFVFLDPPYDCVFSDYGNEEYREGFSEDSHRQLAKDFAQLPCMALMVIGRTPVTETLYKGYIVDEYAKSYAVNIRNRFRSEATHIVVANYKKQWDDVRIYAPQYAVYNDAPSQLSFYEAKQPYGKN
ncbi:MAG: Dam family site-specific DNA-(adenine-N6)-methyltransferase [Prevotellaceae bacterium]|nr:Dam family site-specific DNA-(adenine-N6)-methyltransferase [Prevotellaceae bacterium]